MTRHMCDTRVVARMGPGRGAAGSASCTGTQGVVLPRGGIPQHPRRASSTPSRTCMAGGTTPARTADAHLDHPTGLVLGRGHSSTLGGRRNGAGRPGAERGGSRRRRLVADGEIVIRPWACRVAAQRECASYNASGGVITRGRTPWRDQVESPRTARPRASGAVGHGLCQPIATTRDGVHHDRSVRFATRFDTD